MGRALLDGGTAREHRQDGEVEAVGVGQRHGRNDAIARAQPERCDDVGGRGSDARMRQRDRLGHPGRARRELHERNAREVGSLCCARGNDERERREHVDAERVHGAAGRVCDAAPSSAVVRTSAGPRPCATAASSAAPSAGGTGTMVAPISHAATTAGTSARAGCRASATLPPSRSPAAASAATRASAPRRRSPPSSAPPASTTRARENQVRRPCTSR